jgi:hypothetical protein
MNGKNWLLASALTAAMAASHGSPALAATCGGVAFDDTLTAGSSALVLNGLGMRKATMFKVDVYVAGLYIPQKSTDGAQIAAANQPWQLLLRFVHDADASDIRDAFEDGFEKSAGDKLDALKDRIATLNAQIVDLQEGDTLSYTYDPASGTVIDVNGKTGAPIAGADFAEALLLISIGAEPPNEELKTGLLGGTCE